MIKSTKSLLQILALWLFAAGNISAQISADAETIYFRVSVTDKYGRSVGGLKKENFKVKDGKFEPQISFFDSAEEPADVALLLDVSDSIKLQVRQHLIKGATDFTQTSNAQNDYSLIAFGNAPYALTEFGSAPAQLEEALQKLAGTKLKKQLTSFYDSCIFALEKLEKSRRRKKVLLIFSGGEDNKSDQGFGKLRERVKASDVLIYSISVVDREQSAFLQTMQGQAFLDELTAVSGGKSHFALNPHEIGESVKSITTLLQYQYVIGYKAPIKTDKDKWRAVEVKAELLDTKGKKFPVRVYSRSGYYSEKPTR